MKQPFSASEQLQAISFKFSASASAQFEKEQLQKEERTYSRTVRQIVLCREHIELAHDCAD
jgi:hypothetical protein